MCWINERQQSENEVKHVMWMTSVKTLTFNVKPQPKYRGWGLNGENKRTNEWETN